MMIKKAFWKRTYSKLKIKEETIVKPLPSPEFLRKKEKLNHVVFPDDYREFLLKYNGGVPVACAFDCNGHGYAVMRFLCVLENYIDSKMGWYDISVVESQIGDRLTDNPDLVGMDVVPIAELFAGDYLCLDFRKDPAHPIVCVWSHEESGLFDPVMYKVANSFSEFTAMLYE